MSDSNSAPVLEPVRGKLTNYFAIDVDADDPSGFPPIRRLPLGPSAI